MGRGTARSAVEGLPHVSAAMRNDQPHRWLNIPSELKGGDTQNPKPPPPQPLLPFLVALRNVASLVHLAVDLDDELGVGAVEVDYIRPERVLAAELESVRTGLQHLPKRRLGGRHFAAE